MPSHRPSGGRMLPPAVGVGQSRNGSPPAAVVGSGASYTPLPFRSAYGSSRANARAPLNGPAPSTGTQVAGSGADRAPNAGGVMSALAAPAPSPLLCAPAGAAGGAGTAGGRAPAAATPAVRIQRRINATSRGGGCG